MNAKRCVSLLTPLVLAACVSNPPVIPPPEIITIKVPVTVPCVKEFPKKPVTCGPVNDSRQEYLRCLIANHARTEAYKAELEAILLACKGVAK